MQEVNVEVKGGMVALAVEVGDRKVVALLGEDEATKVIWSLQAARGEAASQREQRKQEAP